MNAENFSLPKITSVENESIKSAHRLHLKKYRTRENRFLIEGVRLVEELVASDLQVEELFVTREVQKNARVEKLIANCTHQKVNIYEISQAISKKLSQTETSQGIFATARKKKYSLKDIKGDNQMLVILDGVQNPLNVGTILRTADAAGSNAVILLNSSDLYGDKVIRGTMGSIFHLPVLSDLSLDELFLYLAEKNFRVYAPSLDKNSCPYFEAKYKGNVAFIFGSEARGVSKLVQEKSFPLHIPMQGKAESLNVGAAAAVILFAALKERTQEKIFNLA